MYDGKEYWRNGGRTGAKWADRNGLVVPIGIQNTLNVAYAASLRSDEMDFETLLKTADEFKNSGSYGCAIRFYEYAVKKADASGLKGILPRLTSCYRAQGQPQKAIDILSYAKEKYGQKMITSALLVSAGAAYCDLKDYKRAKKCCNRAYAMLGKQATGEWKAVYGRIRKESGEVF